MDHHIHTAITEGLRRRGVEVITAYEDGTAELDDQGLLERATQLGRVLFSQDKDLLILAHHWLQTGREFAGLIYILRLSGEDNHATAIRITEAVFAASVLGRPDQVVQGIVDGMWCSPEDHAVIVRPQTLFDSGH